MIFKILGRFFRIVGLVLRQTLGLLESRDPKVEKIMSELDNRIRKNPKEWRTVTANWHEIEHISDNIKFRKDSLLNPYYCRIPFRWYDRFLKHFETIKRNEEVDRLDFCYDVISRKYIYQIQTWNIGNSDKVQECLEWLKKEFPNKQDGYIHKENDNWLYISDESIAVAFKLMWEKEK